MSLALRPGVPGPSGSAPLHSRSVLASAVRCALANLIVTDWRLLTSVVPARTSAEERSLSERSIAAAFVPHLRAGVHPGWDVDVEYNRAGRGPVEVKRRHPDSNPIVPDVIVHRRGESGQANNLLVIELKTNSDTLSSESR